MAVLSAELGELLGEQELPALPWPTQELPCPLPELWVAVLGEMTLLAVLFSLPLHSLHVTEGIGLRETLRLHKKPGENCWGRAGG